MARLTKAKLERVKAALAEAKTMTDVMKAVSGIPMANRPVAAVAMAMDRIVDKPAS